VRVCVGGGGAVGGCTVQMQIHACVNVSSYGRLARVRVRPLRTYLLSLD
jgi:hypothetical protein